VLFHHDVLFVGSQFWVLNVSNAIKSAMASEERDRIWRGGLLWGQDREPRQSKEFSGRVIKL